MLGTIVQLYPSGQMATYATSVPCPQNAVWMWVVYDRPKDFPAHYVVRQHNILLTPPTAEEAVRWRWRGPAPLADSLGTARQFVPADRVRLPRHPDDDPVIVETWV